MSTSVLSRSLVLQWRFLVLALVLLLVLVAAYLFVEHRTVARSQQALLATQARVIEDNMVRQLQATSAGLASVLQDLDYLQQRDNWQALMGLRLRALAGAMPGVRSLWLLNAQGQVLASANPEFVGMMASDRDYMVGPRQQPDAQRLYISAPFRSASNLYSFNVSRAAVSGAGELRYVATARLDPDFFETLLGSVRFADDVRVGLAHGNGQLLNFVPERVGLVGQSLLVPGSFFSRHLALQSPASVLAGRNGLTGEQSFMAQRTVQPPALHMDFPLVVAISRDQAAVFADWWQKIGLSLGLLSILALVTVGSLYQHQRHQRRMLNMAAQQELLKQQADAEIRRLAFHDSLTGLPNRRMIADRLAEVLSACLRHQRQAALLYIDLDNFKPLNDNHGHAEGDVLLTLVAQRLQACVRAEDTVGRLGGDEFVVILPELDPEPAEARRQVAAVCRKLLKALAEPYPLDAVTHECTASIGVAFFGNQRQDVQAILGRADAAMYKAKEQGRNTCWFAD